MGRLVDCTVGIILLLSLSGESLSIGRVGGCTIGIIVPAFDWEVSIYGASGCTVEIILSLPSSGGVSIYEASGWMYHDRWKYCNGGMHCYG